MNQPWISQLSVLARELKRPLQRLPWYGPLSAGYRFATSRNERLRHRLLQDDFKASLQTWPSLTDSASHRQQSKSALILSHISSVWAYKLDMVISLVLQDLRYKLTVVYSDYDVWRQRYHRLIGVTDFVDFRNLSSRCRPDGRRSEAVTDEPGIASLEELMALSWEGVDIGRIALSNILYRNKFSGLDFSDTRMAWALKRELKEVKRNVVAAQELIEKFRPDCLIALEKGLSPIAEIYGVCTARGIPFIQYLSAQHMNDFVLKRFSLANRYQHPFSLDEKTWSRVKDDTSLDEKGGELLRGFEQDYKTGAWFNRKYLHEGKKIMPAEEALARLRLDPAKKTAVIFSHVLWDATFFYGRGLFKDYETWLIETIKAAAKNDKLNWVIKLHPDLVWKLKYENHKGELRDSYLIRSALGNLPPHMQIILPTTEIDTFSFFNITNYCLTVRGTIGIEMACRGVPVLTAGTGRYSNLGFTIDSSSVEEYLNRFSKLEEIPPMMETQVKLARRFAYTLFYKRPWPMKSFEMVKRKLGELGHPLDMNVLPVPPMATREAFFEARDIKSLKKWFDSSEVDFLREE